MDYSQSSILDVVTTKQGIHYSSAIAKTRVNPILKWPGGKAAELGIILPSIPADVSRYFEPFLGGGAVFFSIADHIPAFVNDKSSDLMRFYTCIRDEETLFFSSLEAIQTTWQALEQFTTEYEDTIIAIYDKYDGTEASKKRLKAAVVQFLKKQHPRLRSMITGTLDHDTAYFLSEIEKNLVGKIVRTYAIEEDSGTFTFEEVSQNIESALKSGLYMYLRRLYNHPKQYTLETCFHSALFFFMREYSYASMFRFNSQGLFNVPYGGITYNRKNFGSKVKAMKQEDLLRRLRNTSLNNTDFLDFFFKHKPKSDDFIFLDPPYDTDFSSYDGNSFVKDDHSRLASYLINECICKFMLVIKHTDYILSLYDHKGLNVREFDKKYMWTIKERNNRDTIHLMITNY